MFPPCVKFPLLLINFKTYEESLGAKAINLTKLAEEISLKTKKCIALAPQTIDLRLVARNSKLPIFAQHVDPITYGRNTGYNLPEAVSDAGCSGTLINHSERRLDISTIETTVKRAKDIGLVAIVCIDKPENAKQVAAFWPDAIAIEPPELIGTGIPVSKAKPHLVSGAIKAVKKVNPLIKVLCGAGITSGDDVRSAKKLGAEGVLVASGIVKAKDPYKSLLDLALAI